MILEQVASGPKPGQFEQAATEVLADLQAAFAALVAATHNPIRSGADVQRALGIDQKLAWQVFRVITAPNPLAAGAAVPAQTSARRLALAARKRRVAREIAARVEESVRRFDSLVQEHATDRDEFAAMVADWSPGGRERRSNGSRLAIHKAMSELTGISAKMELFSFVVHPSSDGMNMDAVRLLGFFGLRRIRPGVRVGSSNLAIGLRPGKPRTLDKAEIDEPASCVLPQFCSQPTPQFEVHCQNGRTDYWLQDSDIGLRSAVDLVSADLRGSSRCSDSAFRP
jgi:hypothetical protein